MDWHVDSDDDGAGDNGDKGATTIIGEDSDGDEVDDVNNQRRRKITNDFFYYSNQFSKDSWNKKKEKSDNFNKFSYYAYLLCVTLIMINLLFCT